LLNERAHVSPEIALRVEKAFGVDKVMRIQNSYDIAQTLKLEREIKVMPFKSGKDKAAASF